MNLLPVAQRANALTVLSVVVRRCAGSVIVQIQPQKRVPVRVLGRAERAALPHPVARYNVPGRLLQQVCISYTYLV